MDILRAGRYWVSVVVIVLVVAISVGMALLLNSLLPDTGRAKDVAGTIQSFVTVVAIVIGAYFAYSRLQIFRTFEPHVTISHKVSHRRLSDSYVHIDATAILHNNSKVQIGLQRGFSRLQGVSPVSDEEAESLYARTFDDREDDNLQWPVLQDLQRVWGKSELVVEPGESHEETFEFVIRESDYKSVLIYTYFYNPRYRKNADSAEGWAATTVYDIVEES